MIQLPIEIQIMIGFYLEPVDYTYFRLCTKAIQLPLCQTMAFQTYKNTTDGLCNISAHQAKLRAEYLNEEQLLYLVKKPLVVEFERVYHSPYIKKIPRKSKQMILEQILSIKHLEPVPDYAKIMAGYVLKDLVHTIDSKEMTFLLPLAALCNNSKIVCEILQFQPHVHSFCLSNALIIAAFFGYAKTVGLLLEDERINSVKQIHLMAATKQNHLDVLSCFFQNEKMHLLMADGEEALMTVASCGSYEAMELLLQHPQIGPALASNQLLTVATSRGRIEIVTVLLKDPRSNPCLNASEVLIIACHSQNTEIVKLLLEDGRVDPRAQQGAPLTIAVALGSIDMVTMLLNDCRIVKEDVNMVYQLAKQMDKPEIMELVRTSFNFNEISL
jgi:hypothetical protein